MRNVVAAVLLPDHISQRQNSPESSSCSRKLRGVYEVDKLIEIMEAMGIPFAYDHFAEGESPEPPFMCAVQSRGRW